MNWIEKIVGLLSRKRVEAESVKSTNTVGVFSAEDFPVHYLRRSAADFDTNTIIEACTRWAARAFPEAPLRVGTLAQSGEVEHVDDHPLEILFKRPNSFYSRSNLWAALMASRMLEGNAYIWKERDSRGILTGLWWMPNHMTAPKGSRETFIDYYEYRVDGREFRFAPEDVLHLRDGLDASNPRLGRSALRALLDEVLTDNEARSYTQSILGNLGVVGTILSPATADASFPSDPDELARIERRFDEKFKGKHRGSTFVASASVKADKLSYNPQEMVLDKIRRIPEERISAVLGIPAIVVGLGAGLERSTMANYREAREQAHESMIAPAQMDIAEQLDMQILEDVGGRPGEFTYFDNSKVRVFQEDEIKRHERIRLNWQANLYTLGQVGEMLGFEVPAGEQNLRYADLSGVGLGRESSPEKRAAIGRMKASRRMRDFLADDD